MEGYWDRKISASCYGMELFKNFAIANTGRSRISTLSTTPLMSTSFQYGYGCILRYTTYSYHLEPSNVSKHTRVSDRSHESRLPVSSNTCPKIYNLPSSVRSLWVSPRQHINFHSFLIWTEPCKSNIIVHVVPSKLALTPNLVKSAYNSGDCKSSDSHLNQFTL
jgi:hypothetical protein